MKTSNPSNWHLERFLEAQGAAYGRALDEMIGGYKQSHWIWYIFPQLKVLGRSEMARFYGLASFEEAEAYFKNKVLRDRLIEITKAVIESAKRFKRTANEIFGYDVDAMKFKSCCTLFKYVWKKGNYGNPNVFEEALKLFDGEECRYTKGNILKSIQ